MEGKCNCGNSGPSNFVGVLVDEMPPPPKKKVNHSIPDHLSARKVTNCSIVKTL